MDPLSVPIPVPDENVLLQALAKHNPRLNELYDASLKDRPYQVRVHATRKTMAIRQGTIFERSRISLKAWAKLLTHIGKNKKYPSIPEVMLILVPEIKTRKSAYRCISVLKGAVVTREREGSNGKILPFEFLSLLSVPFLTFHKWKSILRGEMDEEPEEQSLSVFAMNARVDGCKELRRFIFNRDPAKVVWRSRKDIVGEAVGQGWLQDGIMSCLGFEEIWKKIEDEFILRLEEQDREEMEEACRTCEAKNRPVAYMGFRILLPYYPVGDRDVREYFWIGGTLAEEGKEFYAGFTASPPTRQKERMREDLQARLGWSARKVNFVTKVQLRPKTSQYQKVPTFRWKCEFA